jgi:hypothetical protein
VEEMRSMTDAERFVTVNMSFNGVTHEDTKISAMVNMMCVMEKERSAVQEVNATRGQ